MKILGMGANPYNSRDGIIVEGCKSILNISQFDRYVFIDDHKIQSLDAFYPNEKFDLIVYCGTPWLWDGMQHTAKYMNTINVISNHLEAKVVWLGIGSSLYLGDEFSGVLRNDNDKDMLFETFKNQIVISRDCLARNLLNESMVTNHYLPCPSFFFNPVCETSKEFNVAFYHAPRTGISKGYWNQEKLETYRETFKKFVKDNHAKVVVCDPAEIPYAEALFKTTDIHLIEHNIDTFYWCKRAKKVLSGRIHNAVPSMVYGAEVGIVPVDTRHLTITDWFDIRVDNLNDLGKIQKCDTLKLKTDNIEAYRELIRKK